MTLPTAPLSFSQIQTEFGGSNPVSLSEYYRGGAYVGSGTSSGYGTIPTSGAITVGVFRGTQKATAAFSPNVLIHVAAGNFNASGAVNASVVFNSNGTVTLSATPITDDASGPTNWASPTTTGIGSSYWIRATATSGTLTTGTSGAWVSLASNVTFAKSTSGTGTSTVTFTIDIASDAAGSNIVFTKAGNTLQYIHNYSV